MKKMYFSTLVVLEYYPASVEFDFEAFVFREFERPPMHVPSRRHNVSDKKSYTEVYISR